MIRPYLTVLKDSFHEAFASRVLWVVLVVSTLILASLLPIGLKQQTASQLYSDSIENWPDLLTKIKSASNQQSPSPGKQVWTLASDDFRERVNNIAKEKEPERIDREAAWNLLEDLNKVLENKEFYSEPAWANTKLSRRSTELLEKGIANLSDEQRFTLNRHLLRDAFPKSIAQMPDEELVLTYLGSQVGGPLPVSRQMAKPIINQLLSQVMNFFVGTIGIFVGILVTASIIPHMFEAGAIDLLLSKPVSRPMLFLVKFLGGCVFVLLTSSYFIVGLWAILGWRLGEWNSSLLLCIPIFMFQFVIYYSISAAAGVFWRNATLSIVMTIIFWVCCTSIGTVKGVVEQLFIKPTQIVKLVPTKDSLIAINEGNEMLEWNAGNWQIAMKSEQDAPPFGGNPGLIGPLYDSSQDRLLFAQSASPRRRSGFFIPTSQIVSAKWTDGAWKQEPGPNAPQGTLVLFITPEQNLAAISPTGITEVDFKKRDPEIFGFAIPGLNRSGPRQLIVDPDFTLSSSFLVSLSPFTNEIAFLNNGNLTILAPEEKGTYQKRIEKSLGENFNASSIALGATTTFILLEDGSLQIYRNDDLSQLKTITSNGSKAENSQVIASPDGKLFAVQRQDNQVELYDQSGERKGQINKTTTAIAFEGDTTLLIASGKNVYTHNLADGKTTTKNTAPTEMTELLYHYLISPAYLLFPKPAQLSALISGLVDNSDSTMPPGMSRFRQRMKAASNEYFDVIVSNMAFVVVIMGLTCLYVTRTDF